MVHLTQHVSHTERSSLADLTAFLSDSQITEDEEPSKWMSIYGVLIKMSELEHLWATEVCCRVCENNDLTYIRGRTAMSRFWLCRWQPFTD